MNTHRSVSGCILSAWLMTKTLARESSPRLIQTALRRVAESLLLLVVVGCGGNGGGGGSGSGSEGGTTSQTPETYLVPVLVSATTSLSNVESSEQHACATSTDGTTSCWGSNQYGELGTSAVFASCHSGFPCTGDPQVVTTPLKFVVLGAGMGAGATCGLVASGDAYCWGFGLGGQLGDGLNANSSVPVAVAGGHQFQRLRVHPSGLGACAQTSTLDIYCWGPLYGIYGQTGSDAFSTPHLVDWGHVFVDFDLGELHACGITADGDAFCWGNNWYGQLGLGSAGGAGGVPKSETPQQVRGVSGLTQIVTGSDASCGLRSDGAAFCWGSGLNVGSVTTASYSGTPSQVAGSIAFASLYAGFTNTCALTPNGQAYCWGSNGLGALGDNSEVDSPVPVRVQTDVRFAKLSHRPQCGLSTTGQVYCWGSNYQGQDGRAPFHP